MTPREVVSAVDFETLEDRAADALTLIVQYGGIDGDHHKAWVLDQVVRVLTGSMYDMFVKEATNNGEYEWDTGIAP